MSVYAKFPLTGCIKTSGSPLAATPSCNAEAMLPVGSSNLTPKGIHSGHPRPLRHGRHRHGRHGVRCARLGQAPATGLADRWVGCSVWRTLPWCPFQTSQKRLQRPSTTEPFEDLSSRQATVGIPWHATLCWRCHARQVLNVLICFVTSVCLRR